MSEISANAMKHVAGRAARRPSTPLRELASTVRFLFTSLPFEIMRGIVRARAMHNSQLQRVDQKLCVPHLAVCRPERTNERPSCGKPVSRLSGRSSASNYRRHNLNCERKRERGREKRRRRRLSRLDSYWTGVVNHNYGS